MEYKEILELIKEQFVTLMQKEYDYYKDYNIKLSDEITFLKKNDRNPNNIYITMKFGSAEVNFGQEVIPVFIQALAEKNKLEVCRKLLTDFTQTYTLSKIYDGKVRQVYTAPSVNFNFYEVQEGLRSLLSFSGTILVNNTANDFDLYYKGIGIEFDTILTNVDFGYDINEKVFLDKIGTLTQDRQTYRFEFKNDGYWYLSNNIVYPSVYGITYYGNESIGDYIEITVNKNNWLELDILTGTMMCDITLDPQSFFGQKNFIKSEGQVACFTMNFNTMLFDLPIINKMLKQGIIKDGTYGINEDYEWLIKFKNGLKCKKILKLINITLNKAISDIPTITCSFSE